ncbi:MAG: HAMP domain-containing histidine kinase [Planctomycetes bacterium]|nr:HAMP domain-containing histidine kinase [Planctomycetota bacterium]
MSLKQIRSVRGPAILFVLALVLVVALLILWNVVLAVDYARIKALAQEAEEHGAAFHWTFIALGSALFVTTIVLLSVLGAQLISEIRASQRMASFIATFTHELNSPLASIKLFAQTLRRPGLKPDEQERFLELILSDVERLRGQLQNVLRTAQVDGPLGLQTAPEPTDLNAWLDDYVAARRLGLERTDGKARLTFAAGPPASVLVDRALFRQVIDNLLDNAVKYARPEAGGVAVQVVVAEGARDGTVAVEVRDDGCGVPEGDLERIFERFGRADPGATGARCQGTGLGLWIVRTLVEAHGGEVWATSPGPGRGTTVRLELPVSARPAPAPAAEAPA